MNQIKRGKRKLFFLPSASGAEEEEEEKKASKQAITLTHLVKSVPQSQRYSRVPQVLACALRSAWTA
jgi:hypothetical protein